MSDCMDCQGPIDRPHTRGPVPTLCSTCKKQRRRDSVNQWHRANPEKVLRHKKRKPPKTVLTCIDCDVEFPRSGRFGPVRTWCPTCRVGATKRRNQRNNRVRNLGKYGITPGQFDMVLAAQQGVCAICGTDSWGAKGPHVDHCHDTGIVRGVLCGGCNAGMGRFRDDPEFLEIAARYLRTYRDGHPLAGDRASMELS